MLRGRPRKDAAVASIRESAMTFLQKRGLVVFTAAILDRPDRVPDRQSRDEISVDGRRMTTVSMIDYARSLGFGSV